jgi:serine/threonine-protein kinase
MGVVYEVIDQQTNQKKALKLLASSVSEDLPDVVARFEREVQAASSIHSENIVRVFDAGTDEGSPFMVMELVRGRDLHQWCKQLKQLRPEAVIRVAGQACEGLAAAHAVGVIHRDIKPGNIFLSEYEDSVVAKLLDFGIAKLKMDQVQGDPGLTKTGNMLGSPHYMSPEQAQGLKTIDHRTDIWSLGVVMYKMLTGRTPFADLDSMGQVIIAIWSMPIPPVQDLAPWVTPELAAVVHKALQKKPGERYASAAEMLADLRKLSRDGSFQLKLSHLEPLSEQARSVVAPRLPDAGPEPAEPPRLIGDESTSGTMQAAIENTHPGEMTVASARKKAGISLWIGGSLALIAAVAVVVGAIQVNRVRGESSAALAASAPPVASAAPAASAAASAEVEPPRPAEIRGKVTVPSGVTAKIDGEEVPIRDHTIEVVGPPGSIKTVALLAGKRESKHQVILTEQGPTPSALVLPGPAGKKPPPTPGTTSTGAAPKPPKPGVDRQFD